MAIQFKIGDATMPQGSGPKIIVHCCNDIGAWGAGFVVALSKRWPLAEEAYRAWYAAQQNPVDPPFKGQVDTSGPFRLGEVQLVLVGPKLWVANLIGQHHVGMGPDNRPPIRYDAIQAGLKKVYRLVQIHGAGIHMPRMGSGLAGGRWDAIEKLVAAELSVKGVDVTVYDLP